MDTHEFKTDNEILNQIGLGSFTVDSLREWVEKNNHANLNYTGFDAEFACGTDPHNPKKGVVPFPLLPSCVNEAMTYIVGTNNLVDRPTVDQLYIKNYRPSGRTSEKFTYQWVADRTDPTGLYRGKDEDIWNYNVEEGGVATNIDFDDAFSDLSILGGQSMVAYSRGDDPPWNDHVVAELIAMNDWLVSIKNQEDFPTIYQARAILIRDIITSYDGCLQWKSNFGIRIPTIDGTKVCNIEVDWKLFFYNEGDLEEPVVALNGSPNISTVPVNQTGQQITARNDDERKAIPTGDESEKKTGELDTSYNEFTGKYESGTQQMWAILTTNLAAATRPDTVVPDGTTDLVKKFLDKEAGYGLTHGEAMPLHQKTGNPHNWGPEYKYFDSCDLDADQKIEVDTIPVHNMFAIPFDKGETVLLQRINGQWFPIRAEGAEAARVAGSVSRWQFMYLMSNVDNYFRNSKGDKITFLDYESSVANYYSYIKNNPGGGGTPPVDDIDNITHNAAGYVQCSSFDSMGPQIGGWLAGHVLADTQLGENSDGTVKNLEDIHPLDTAPFFGCVFPDGYVGGSKFITYLNGGPDVPAMMVSGVAQVDSNGIATNDYIKNIDAETAIFAKGNSIAAYGKDMFVKEGDGAALKNLPADIATNALPDSSTGSPMPILKKFEEFLDYNSRSTTLISTIDNTATFDIPPINPLRVQFRPLKLETYASFEIQDNSRFAGLTYDGKNYGDFGGNGWKMSEGTISPPISRKVLERAYVPNALGAIVTEAEVNASFASRGVVVPGGAKADLSLGYNGTVRNHLRLPATNTTFPQQVGQIMGTWSRGVGSDPNDWMLDGPRPAGAFGIIGAQCEVTANEAIKFLATCHYGIQDLGLSQTGGAEQTTTLGIGAAGGGGFTSFSSGGGGPGTFHSTFGQPPASYDTPNNTILCARVYHHHPRELTIYDPRFFAIHHFAEGANEEIETRYYNGTTEITKDEYESGTLDDGTQLSYKYKDEAWKKRVKKYGSTDFSEPTYILDPGQKDNFGVTAIHAATVDPFFADVVKDDPDLPSRWRDPDDWIIKDARGSLLPAKVSMSAIGITDPDLQIKIEEDDQGIPKGGKGYNLSDRFTTRGGSGTNVFLVPVTGDLGSITGFSIGSSSAVAGVTDPKEVSQGRGFLPSDFFTRAEINDDKDSYASSKVKIVPTGDVGGEGLEAYVRFGKIYEEEVVVAKPESAISEQFITITPILGTRNYGGDGNRKGKIYGINEVDAKIANPSSDNTYDVFFHYHNDISHVMQQGDGYGVMSVPEQMIDLTISPL